MAFSVLLSTMIVHLLVLLVFGLISFQGTRLRNRCHTVDIFGEAEDFLLDCISTNIFLILNVTVLLLVLNTCE